MRSWTVLLTGITAKNWKENRNKQNICLRIHKGKALLWWRVNFFPENYKR